MLLSTNNIILENPKEEGASKKRIIRFNNDLDDTVKENKSYQELSDNEIIKENKITNKEMFKSLIRHHKYLFLQKNLFSFQQLKHRHHI